MSKLRVDQLEDTNSVLTINIIDLVRQSELDAVASDVADNTAALAEQARVSFDSFQDMESSTGSLSSGDVTDVQGFKFQYDGSSFKPLTFVSAELWGAVGDGSTDSTAAFQAMFDYLHDIGGGLVVQTGGEYVFTDTVATGGNLKWMSSPNTRYRRDHLLTLIENSLGTSGATSGYDGGNGNILIQGGIFDGNSHGTYYDGFNMFGIGYGRNIYFHEVTILDVVDGHGVDLSSCSNVWFKGCKFLGFANKAGDREFSEAVQLDPNLTGSFFFGALDGTHCENIFMTECVVGSNPDDSDPNFQAWPSAIGNHLTANDRWHRNVHVKGNIFDITYAGVAVFKWIDVFVQGNQMNLNADGIGVRVDNVLSSFNSANNPDGSPSGQPQGGTGLTITDNVISLGNVGVECTGRAESDGGSGIAGGFQERVLISKNIFTGQDAGAITLTWVDQGSIVGNTMDNCYRGLFIRNSRGLQISDNRGSNLSRELIFSEVATINGLSSATVASEEFNSRWTVSNNSGQDIQRWGILMTGLLYSQITFNRIINPSQEDDSRGGIRLGSGSADCFMFGNTVDYDSGAASGGAREGINATPSCDRIVMGGNYTTTGSVDNYSSGGLSLDASYI